MVKEITREEALAWGMDAVLQAGAGRLEPPAFYDHAGTLCANLLEDDFAVWCPASKRWSPER